MRVFLWVVSISLLMICFGCANKKEPKVLKKKQVLRLCIDANVRSLDPRCSHDYPTTHVVKMLFEGLFRTGLDGKVCPALVENYEVSADKKIYTFHLKHSKWSNGLPVTSYDFEYSWKQIIDPSLTLTHSGVHVFYPIKNVQAVIQGKAKLEEIGIKTPNEQTLIVELEHPTPFFIKMLSFASFCPVPKEVDIVDPSWAQKESSYVCNGPFKLKKWKNNYEIVLERNPSYWDSSTVYLKKIHIAVVPDLNTQLSLFEKGEVDWVGRPISKLPWDAIPSLKESNKLNILPCLGLHWYFLNTQTFPFNNAKVRKAFAYAINRKELTEDLLQEGEISATSILPPSLSSKKSFFKDGDVRIAKKLLEEGLIELGVGVDDLKEITLSYAYTDINDKIAQAIQQQWQKAFGIIVHLQHLEWNSYYSLLQEGRFQVGAMGWYSWINDPSYNLETFKHASDGINMSRWENIHYQELLDLARNEIDEEKRYDYFAEAEQILADEMPVIPLFYTRIVYTKSDRLKDFYISELYEIDFTHCYIR